MMHGLTDIKLTEKLPNVLYFILSCRRLIKKTQITSSKVCNSKFTIASYSAHTLVKSFHIHTLIQIYIEQPTILNRLV